MTKRSDRATYDRIERAHVGDRNVQVASLAQHGRVHGGGDVVRHLDAARVQAERCEVLEQDRPRGVVPDRRDQERVEVEAVEALGNVAAHTCASR